MQLNIYDVVSFDFDILCHYLIVEPQLFFLSQSQQLFSKMDRAIWTYFFSENEICLSRHNLLHYLIVIAVELNVVA